MKRITNEGRLDEWCSDNLRYLADTFGRENIVSAVLHMDEHTPHIHATLVPIVKGERKRKKKEEQVKKRYSKKPIDTARLCADEIMTHAKLKSYQDTYAQAMSGYGLQRGIDGSEAKHITTRQYYRDLMQQTEQLRQLQDRKETAQEELKRAKKEVQTEKLKGAATTAATNIAESVGSLFGSNKVKTLERENAALHQVVATHEETIETLQSQIQNTGRPQPSSVGYSAEAHQGIAGEGNRTQERGGRAYYLVEQGSKMVPSNKGYAQSRKGVPCRRFQPRADGGTDDGQAP